MKKPEKIDTGIASLDRDLSEFFDFDERYETTIKEIKSAESPSALQSLVPPGALRIVLFLSDPEVSTGVFGEANDQSKGLLQDVLKYIPTRFQAILEHPQAKAVAKLYQMQGRVEVSRRQNTIIKKLNVPTTVAAFPFFHASVNGKLTPATRLFVMGVQGTPIADMTMDWDEAVYVSRGILRALKEQVQQLEEQSNLRSKFFTDEEVEKLQRMLTESKDLASDLSKWLKAV